MIEAVKELAASALQRVKALYAAQPARVVAWVAAAAVSVAAAFDVVLDSATTAQVVSLVLLLLLGGEVTRQNVTPVGVAAAREAAALKAKPPTRKKR